MPEPTDQELVEYYLTRIAQVQNYTPDDRLHYFGANQERARRLIDDLRDRPETRGWTDDHWHAAFDAVLIAGQHIWDEHDVDYGSMAVALAGWKLGQ